MSMPTTRAPSMVLVLSAQSKTEPRTRSLESKQPLVPSVMSSHVEFPLQPSLVAGLQKQPVPPAGSFRQTRPSSHPVCSATLQSEFPPPPHEAPHNEAATSAAKV